MPPPVCRARRNAESRCSGSHRRAGLDPFDELEPALQSELAPTVFHVRSPSVRSFFADRTLRWRPDVSLLKRSLSPWAAHLGARQAGFELAVQPQLVGDLADVLAVLAAHERDADAGLAGAAGAADAVGVGLGVDRRVELDDVGDA